MDANLTTNYLKIPDTDCFISNQGIGFEREGKLILIDPNSKGWLDEADYIDTSLKIVHLNRFGNFLYHISCGLSCRSLNAKNIATALLQKKRCDKIQTKHFIKNGSVNIKKLCDLLFVDYHNENKVIVLVGGPPNEKLNIIEALTNLDPGRIKAGSDNQTAINLKNQENHTMDTVVQCVQNDKRSIFQILNPKDISKHTLGNFPNLNITSVFVYSPLKTLINRMEESKHMRSNEVTPDMLEQYLSEVRPRSPEDGLHIPTVDNVSKKDIEDYFQHISAYHLEMEENLLTGKEKLNIERQDDTLAKREKEERETLLKEFGWNNTTEDDNNKKIALVTRHRYQWIINTNDSSGQTPSERGVDAAKKILEIE